MQFKGLNLLEICRLIYFKLLWFPLHNVFYTVNDLVMMEKTVTRLIVYFLNILYIMRVPVLSAKCESLIYWTF